MKKKILVLLIAVIALCSGVIMACSPQNEPNSETVFTVLYGSTEGGYVDGDVAQKVKKGQNATSVKAIARETYRFVKWSDGIETAERTDSHVSMNMTLTAIFAADTKEIESFKVFYSVTDGGYITGNTEQTVNKGENATSVKAIAKAGYRFVKWSDGIETAERTDNEINGDLVATAIFEVISRTFTYVYNNATVDMNMPRTITLDYFTPIDKDVQLFYVPERVKSEFYGWFSDKECTKKVADEKGKLVMDHYSFMTLKSDKLYAGFNLKGELKTYNVLMLFVTEVNGTFPDLNQVHVKMTDFEKAMYKLLGEKFEQNLDEMSLGLVDFQVDVRFTDDIVTDDCFGPDTYIPNSHPVNNNAIKTWLIPEISDQLDQYESVLTTVRLEDNVDNIFENQKPFYLGPNFYGSAGPKFGWVDGSRIIDSLYCDLDPMCILEKRDIPEDSRNIYNNWWNSVISLYRHQLIHTVEMKLPEDILKVRYSDYTIHRPDQKNYQYYLNNGQDPNYEEDKAYMLNEAIVEGVKGGIPLEYWKGDFYLTFTFSVVGGGYIIGDDGTSVKLCGVWKGKVCAVPLEGYRFVKWVTYTVNFADWYETPFDETNPVLERVYGAMGKYSNHISIVAIFEKE